MIRRNLNSLSRTLLAMIAIALAGCADTGTMETSGARSSGYGTGATVSSGAESRPTTKTMPVAPPHASSDVQPGQGSAITGGAEGAPTDQATPNTVQGGQR